MSEKKQSGKGAGRGRGRGRSRSPAGGPPHEDMAYRGLFSLIVSQTANTIIVACGGAPLEPGAATRLVVWAYMAALSVARSTLEFLERAAPVEDGMPPRLPSKPKR